ncbi:hypothetical protein VP01_89g4 [Puccinia sorghi]|uniref:SRP9 domain-containing protein n=1 Tax=Puccinia sorghi TaxID=27349 RepID=A0A0L6U8H5_9BASI|nr:hypothetical protein VP01_89g4 [Puccinia sorghi]
MCLKFKTRSAVYLNRFELMTRALIEQMQNVQIKKATVEPEPASKAGSTKPKDPSSASLPPPLSSTAKPAPPSSKKKKGKKKK